MSGEVQKRYDGLVPYWAAEFTCTVCDRVVWLKMELLRHRPDSDNVLRYAATVHARWAMRENYGWQLEPTRCPEHARVVA